MMREGLRRTGNTNLVNGKKKSMYDSDANGNGLDYNGMNLTSGSSNMPHFKKLIQDKSMSQNLGKNMMAKGKKGVGISTGPNFKRPFKKDDEFTCGYKYVTPIKEYPSKYGPTKIKIHQDITTYDHHLTHPFNIFSNQYNEFIKLVLKN